MVLPVSYTKGLEFDAVLLLEPTAAQYPEDDGNAKLLYVALQIIRVILHIRKHFLAVTLLLFIKGFIIFDFLNQTHIENSFLSH